MRQSRYRAEHHGLYNRKEWKLIRRRVFTRDEYRCMWPGCGVDVTGKGQQPNAPVAHHICDHKGDLALFRDLGNIMTVCKACHDRHAQRTTHQGFIAGSGEDGRPLDPLHPWNRRQGAVGHPPKF